MIELIVGFIGSGKSSYSQKRAKEGALIINDDDLVNACHAAQNTLYQITLKPLYKLLENTILHYGVANKFDIIIDRPNLSRNTRIRYIEIAHSLDTQIAAVCMPIITKEVAIERRMKNNRGYSKEKWEKTWDRMMIDYTPPCEEEGFDFIWQLK